MAPRADYEGPMAEAYDAGRSLFPETVEAWHKALWPLRPESPYPILDLGAGTGRFSGLLAEWFARDVVAVEPADAMRRQAGARTSDRVWVVGGSAERLPLRNHCVSLAFLSNVIHHFDDLPAAAKELRRVLRLACRVLIRGWFSGLTPDLGLWDYFPRAGEAARRFPGLDQITDAFRPHGFAVEMTVRVEQRMAESPEQFLERMPSFRRADSTLAPLPDDEFAAGLRQVEEAITQGRALPLRESLDLVVLR